MNNIKTAGGYMKELFTGISVINQFMQVIPLTLLVGLFCIIFRFLKLKKNNSDVNSKKRNLVFNICMLYSRII